MARSSQTPNEVLKLAASARGLVWRHWDEAYVVYQPSSAETHVFNETTAVILKCLENGALTPASLRHCTAEFLSIAEVELAADAFSFAVERLEELGLIERSDEASSVRCSSVT